MYIELNPEIIILHFNPHPTLKVIGPEKTYYVELREYGKNDSNSKIVESFEILGTENPQWIDTFKCFIEFKCDFEISIYKFVDKVGLHRIFTHRYSENQQNVKFNLHTQNEEDSNLWTNRIEYYKKVNNCLVSVNSNFEYLNERFDYHPDDETVEYYKTYNIGRFPKMSTDFRSNDERMEGFVWLGNWKKFWSYQHPRFWMNLSSQEIIDDILGLSE